MLIGEWGAFGNAGAEILPAARFHVSLFERFLFSNTYWAYTRELKNAAFLEALQRPIPKRVSGRLLAIRTDFDRGEFTCSWEEVASVTAPTIIYLPKRAFMGRDAVKLSPAGEGFSVEPVARRRRSCIYRHRPEQRWSETDAHGQLELSKGDNRQMISARRRLIPMVRKQNPGCDTV